MANANLNQIIQLDRDNTYRDVGKRSAQILYQYWRSF